MLVQGSAQKTEPALQWPGCPSVPSGEQLKAALHYYSRHLRGGRGFGPLNALYHVSMKKVGVTLGVFQMQDAPWEVPGAVKLVIDRLLEAGIKPSFCNENSTQLALHW